MTPSQNAKYFFEFGQLRDVLLAKGWAPIRIEEHRRTLTRKALGVDKSSKEFTNAELDRVLAVIRAEREPANFEAQLALQDMPEKRRALLVHRITALAYHTVDEGGRGTSYVDGIARKMFGCAYHDCDERGLQQIEGIVRRRIRQRKFTSERVQQIEAEATAHAAKMLSITAPEIERQAAIKAEAARIVHSEEAPLF